MKTKSTSFTKKTLVLLISAIAIPAISLAQWSTQIILSPGAVRASLNESMGPCLGVSGDTIHTIWTDQRMYPYTKINVLYYSRSIDTGLFWTAPVAITSINGNAWHPVIAVSGKNVHVAWEEVDTITNKRNSYYKHSLDGGNTWSANRFIDSTSDWPGLAVSGNNVYIVNDRHINATNSEIFFLRSMNNGVTWSGETQLTSAPLRSEDEGIVAQGSHIHMSWNDNRTGAFQIFYKESSDYGVTWGPDVVVDLAGDYNTMVCSNGPNVDVIATGAPSGRYQLRISQSADTGVSWLGVNGVDLSNDTAHTYYLPYIVRDGSNIHVVVNSSGGAKYFHSGNGGATWDPPYAMPGASFIAYTGCMLHVLYTDITHKVYYLRNPTGNTGTTCTGSMGINPLSNQANELAVYPNPAKNNFTLKSETELGTITIYNALGGIIYKEKTNSTQQQIDMSKHAAGVYFVQAQNTFIKIIKE